MTSRKRSFRTLFRLCCPVVFLWALGRPLQVWGGGFVDLEIPKSWGCNAGRQNGGCGNRDGSCPSQAEPANTPHDSTISPALENLGVRKSANNGRCSGFSDPWRRPTSCIHAEPVRNTESGDGAREPRHQRALRGGTRRGFRSNQAPVSDSSRLETSHKSHQTSPAAQT